MWDRLLAARASADPTVAAIVDVDVSEFAARSFDEVTVGDVCARCRRRQGHVLPILRLQGIGVHRRRPHGRAIAWLAPWSRRRTQQRRGRRCVPRSRPCCHWCSSWPRAHRGKAAVPRRRPRHPRSHRRGTRRHTRRSRSRRDAVRGGSDRPGHRHVWAGSLTLRQRTRTRFATDWSAMHWTNPPGRKMGVRETPIATVAVAVQGRLASDENFPVASRLLPRRQRGHLHRALRLRPAGRRHRRRERG